MKWNADEQRDPTKRAYNLADQLTNTPKEVFDMVVKFKKAQQTALNKIKKLEKEYPEMMNEEIISHYAIDQSGEEEKEVPIYSSRREKILKEITETFIKEFASIMIHEKSDPVGDTGPEYLYKKSPPNIKFSFEDQELVWEIERKTEELKKYGNKPFQL